VVLAGGGTGGHLFPGLALAEALREARPDAEVLFLGSDDGIEVRELPKHGLALKALPSVKAARLSALPRAAVNLARSYLRARRAIRRFGAEALVALGGYGAVAPALAARTLRVPVVALEQNAIPGRATRLVARWSEEVHLSFADAASAVRARGRVLVTGNPVRRAVLESAGAPDEARDTILVLGGSQGARRLNELAAAALRRLAPRVRGLKAVVLAGPAWEEEARRLAAGCGMEVTVTGFSDAMHELYARARAAISRAGATAVAELACAGIPAVLVPFPFAKDDHQTANARVLERDGGSVVFAEKDLTPEALADALEGLLADPARREAMREGLRRSARPRARATVAASVLALADRFASARGSAG
jgi:UDP-N-acetylglucosamine--N-acetylmuramyl-(pentapeptide) pyrophosphoryl-undecaprenol N-acetylglucosamine transferase